MSISSLFPSCNPMIGKSSVSYHGELHCHPGEKAESQIHKLHACMLILISINHGPLTRCHTKITLNYYMKNTNKTFLADSRTT